MSSDVDLPTWLLRSSFAAGPLNRPPLDVTGVHGICFGPPCDIRLRYLLMVISLGARDEGARLQGLPCSIAPGAVAGSWPAHTATSTHEGHPTQAYELY